MNDADLGFIHRYVEGGAADAPVLLLLHGTGGNEDDLLPLGAALAPGATLLSPRGRVLESGMPRFFRRLAEGVFDQEDLKRQTAALGDFVAAAVERYGLGTRRVVAVGFSNGANVGASLLLTRPGLLSGAVLFRAMVPYVPEHTPDLGRVPIFIGAGRQDPIVPAENVERLARIFREAGATVELRWQPGGHGLTQADLAAAQAWLQESFAGRSAAP
jgi:phospholipase/carboxylesterase